MNRRAVGVDVDDFRLPPKEALRRASELAFRVVEFATVSGDLAPEKLSTSGRRHLSRYLDGLGLRVAALTADIPGLRLTDPKTASERVGRTCEIIELAADLRVPVVTASVGALTHPETGQPSPLAVETLREIGDFADSRGTVYALRPSSDNDERLACLFEAIRCPSLGLGHDAAALVMAGTNPIPIITRFGEQIPLVHVRDGTVGLSGRAGHETRLGDGDVDVASVLAAFAAIDYSGPLVIRRRDSQSPIPDIQHGRDVLRKILPRG